MGQFNNSHKKSIASLLSWSDPANSFPKTKKANLPKIKPK